MQGLSPREMPPYLVLDNTEVTNYQNKYKNTTSSNLEGIN